jgi:hypothetical protein
MGHWSRSTPVICPGGRSPLITRPGAGWRQRPDGQNIVTALTPVGAVALYLKLSNLNNSFQHQTFSAFSIKGWWQEKFGLELRVKWGRSI